jgi:hypothetical protein
MGKAVSMRAEGSGWRSPLRLCAFLRPFLKLSPIPM